VDFTIGSLLDYFSSSMISLLSKLSSYCTLDVLLETNIEFGYLDADQYYSMVHPKWNLLLFVGVGDENDIIAYNMDSRKVHVIPTRYSAFSNGMSCHKTSADLTIFPMFSCSWSWSH
jgi:hypothetical protein